ncbi:MAG: tetraacyldisaccharide 4'-kinase [Chlorobi bacterium]|nr:tetraacyldisaccharide 4'-kinase [Chlorobiota bacterium]
MTAKTTRRWLKPAAFLFRSLVQARNLAFDRQWFAVRHPGVPVISVGNIAVGGAGKTPLVAFLADMISGWDRKVAVVSRGYARKSRGTVVVSDGSSILVPVEVSGDEPAMLARKLPRIVIVVDEERYRGCRIAVERFGVDAIILDDAFQHRACGRDLDVVAVEAGMNLQEEELLPAGRLREPVASLARADIVVLTKCPSLKGCEDEASKLFHACRKPVFPAAFEPVAMVDWFEKSEVRIPESAYVVSGVAHPERFLATLGDLGVRVVGSRIFRDHHWFSDEDVAWILGRAAESGARTILTTEKDAVRLERFAHSFSQIPLYVVIMEMRLLRDQQAFSALIEKVVSAGEFKRHG